MLNSFLQQHMFTAHVSWSKEKQLYYTVTQENSIGECKSFIVQTNSK